MSAPAGVAPAGVAGAAREPAPPHAGDAAIAAALAYVAALGSGALYFLGYVGWGVWPCLFVFLVPLWRALERAPVPAFLLGFGFGLAAFAGGYGWMWRLVEPFLDGDRVFGALLWLAYGAWFAAGWGVYAVVVRVLRRRGWPVAAAGVAPLVVLEWIQPQIFPLYLGNALVGAPIAVQTADLGGPLLLTTLVAGANAVAYETWTWWRGMRPTPTLAWTAALAATVVVIAYGAVRMRAIDAASAAAPELRVGIVQANLSVADKAAASVTTHRLHLEQTRELLAGGPLDLVVWPETAYVRGIRRPLPVSGRTILDDVTVPLLFGGGSVVESDGRRRTSNSAFLVGADGMIRDVYDKNLLIPLAEYLPLVDTVPALREWFPRAEEFFASTETPALHLGPWRLATPICYEAIRPELVRRMMATARPHVLVTLANDAWFGDSQEPWIHLALSRLRAVEQRRWLVRATNSGVSAIIDPAGRLVARTDLFTRTTLRAVVRPLDGETVYARFGDWPGWLAAVVVVAALVRPAPRSSR